METYKIIRDYKTKYDNPIILYAAQIVTLGKEETEEKWKGWIWAESASGKGWVPKQIIEMDAKKQVGKILEYYSAKELNVNKGDEIQKITSLNGWTWSKNIKTSEEGWLPDEVIGTKG